MALQSLPKVQPLPPSVPDVPGFAYYSAPQWQPEPLAAVVPPQDGGASDALDQHFSYFDALGWPTIDRRKP